MEIPESMKNMGSSLHWALGLQPKITSDTQGTTTENTHVAQIMGSPTLSWERKGTATAPQTVDPKEKYLDFIKHQESSSGANKSNAKNDAGKFGYLYGITHKTFSDIMKRKPNLNLNRSLLDTESGARQVAGHILQDKREIQDKMGKVVETLPYDVNLYLKGYTSMVGKNPQMLASIQKSYNDYFASSTKK